MLTKYTVFLTCWVGSLIALAPLTHATCINSFDSSDEPSETEKTQFYQQALSYQLKARLAPIFPEHKRAEKLRKMTKWAENNVLPVDISTLPEENAQTTQEKAVELLFTLAAENFTGQYLPKNDTNTLKYLEKLVDYDREHDVFDTNELMMGFGIAVGHSLRGEESEEQSCKNPMYQLTEAELSRDMLGIVIKAGHDETRERIKSELK